MTTFPIQLQIDGRPCVIVGGGAVAARKMQALLECGAQVTIVAPEGVEIIAVAAEAGFVTWRRRAYEAGDLAGAWVVFAATDSKDVNSKVVAGARERGILVCDASTPGAGDFVSPSVLRRGELSLTVSTGGGSPTLAAVVREELAAHYGPEWEQLVAIIGGLRGAVQAAGDEARRRQSVRRVINDPQVRECLARGQVLEATERARECLLSYSE